MAHLMRRATHRVTATGHMLQRGSSLPSCRRLQGWAAAAAATPAQVCRDEQSRSAPVCGHFYKMLISLKCGLFTLLKNQVISSFSEVSLYWYTGNSHLLPQIGKVTNLKRNVCEGEIHWS